MILTKHPQSHISRWRHGTLLYLTGACNKEQPTPCSHNRKSTKKAGRKQEHTHTPTQAWFQRSKMVAAIKRTPVVLMLVLFEGFSKAHSLQCYYCDTESDNDALTGCTKLAEFKGDPNKTVTCSLAETFCVVSVCRQQKLFYLHCVP
jgi:hypothetical protein